MSLGGIPAEVWGIAGAITGGVGTHLSKRWLMKADQEIRNRVSYRDEIAELLARVDKLEDDLGKMRELYYAEREYSSYLRLKLIEAGIIQPGDGHGPITLDGPVIIPAPPQPAPGDTPDAPSS